MQVDTIPITFHITKQSTMADESGDEHEVQCIDEGGHGRGGGGSSGGAAGGSWSGRGHVGSGRGRGCVGSGRGAN